MQKVFFLTSERTVLYTCSIFFKFLILETKIASFHCNVQERVSHAIINHRKFFQSEYVFLVFMRSPNTRQSAVTNQYGYFTSFSVTNLIKVYQRMVHRCNQHVPLSEN